MQPRTINTLSFQSLKFVPLSLGIELILADMAVADELAVERKWKNYAHINIKIQ
jgi:hypothetical protein